MFQHLRRLYDARKPNYMPMNALDMELKGRGESWTFGRIEQLVESQRRERPNLEFKLSLDSKERDNQTKRPWAAMANSGGGEVIYGVQESATVAIRLRPVRLAGVEERIAQENERIDPPTHQTVHIVQSSEDSERGFVVVTVRPAVRGVVHLVDGRAPKRVETTTSYMTSEEIRRWIVEGERP
jgi:predicted HTH transcriptional regulator